MPYARVGVIPQATANNDRPTTQQRQSRKQGITMGDLKKQTALRLAQEQQQTRFFPNLTQQRKEEAAVLEHNVYPRVSYPDPRQPPPQTPVIQPPPMQQSIVYPRSNSVVSNTPSFSSENSNRQQGQQSANQKSKLPHGLTVQELKEMTKARLQAEHQPEPDPTRSALQFHHQQHFQQQHPRHEVRGSPFSERSRNMPHAFGREHMMSPLPPGPPGFQSLPSQTSLSSAPEVSRQSSWQQPGLEAWETGSVDTHNSTINSDYLGSESTYPADEFGDIPFGRSRSYPVTPAGMERQQYDGHGNMNGNPSYFDNMNSNRRRAVTMSPRTLSHLHEDRPSCGGVSALNVPFDSPPQNHSSFRPSAINDNGLSGYSGVSRTFSGPTGVSLNNGNISFNRPRTASAPSVSSTFMSQTGDMFGDNNGFASLSSDIANNDLPKSMVESLLGASSNSFSQEPGDLSSVFRNSSQDAGLQNPWGVGTLAGISSGSDADAALARELRCALSLTPPANEHSLRNSDQVSLFSGTSRTRGPTSQHTLGIYGNSSFPSAEGERRDQRY